MSKKTPKPLAFHEIHCGLLPLTHRFVVIDIGETRWAIPAARGLDLATAYYEREGWYEDCELEEDKKLKQLHGDELRGCVEVNGDLAHHITESRWDRVADVAVLVRGPEVVPPGNDRLWWFTENGGSIDEMTDLPPAKQNPLGPLWFSEAFAKWHGIEVTTTGATK